jgi:uncharacterized protein with FMN-binding domain
MNKRVFTTIGILIGIALIGFAAFYFAYIAPANEVLNEVRNTEIRSIDLSQVADGKYLGEFSYSKSLCKVEVVVINHRIEDIKILENGKNDHAKKAESVISKVIAEQKTNVDVITEATTTSKALLKAVESALSSGLGK